MEAIKREHLVTCLKLSAVCAIVSIGFDYLQSNYEVTSYFLNSFTYYIVVLGLLLAYFKKKHDINFLKKAKDKSFLVLILVIGVFFAGGFIDVGFNAIKQAFSINAPSSSLNFDFIKCFVNSIFLALCSLVLYIITTVAIAKIGHQRCAFVTRKIALEIVIIFVFLVVIPHIIILYTIKSSSIMTNCINRFSMIFLILILLFCGRSNAFNLQISRSSKLMTATSQNVPLIVVAIVSAVVLCSFMVLNSDCGADGWLSYENLINTIAVEPSNSVSRSSYSESTTFVSKATYISTVTSAFVKSYLAYPALFMAICFIAWGLFNSILETKCNLTLKNCLVTFGFSFFMYGASVGFTKLVYLYVSNFSSVANPIVHYSGLVFSVACLALFEVVVYRVLIDGKIDAEELEGRLGGVSLI